MFRLVSTVSYSDAVSAVYEATLRLFQRERLAYIRETHAFAVTENRLAAQLLAEVEADAGKELADLTKEEADRYIVQMSSALRERTRAEIPPDAAARGQAVLEEMRAAWDARRHVRR